MFKLLGLVRWNGLDVNYLALKHNVRIPFPVPKIFRSLQRPPLQGHHPLAMISGCRVQKEGHYGAGLGAHQVEGRIHRAFQVPVQALLQVLGRQLPHAGDSCSPPCLPPNLLQVQGCPIAHLRIGHHGSVGISWEE